MAQKKKDLTGQRFGKLVVVGPTEERKRGYVVWGCRCDCGSTVFVRTDKLRLGIVTSCGCERQKNLTGLRFGRLTVLRQTEERKNDSVVWECLCDCGNTTFVARQGLVTGKTQSCGCMAVEHAKKLGTQNAKNLTGLRFGKLVAVRPTELRKGTFVVWECLCDCGKTHYVTSVNLLHGYVRSCGCLKVEQIRERMKLTAKDLTGQRFGKLVAVRPTELRNNNRNVVWECLCDCGNTHLATSVALLHGYVKSCGCSRRGGNRATPETEQTTDEIQKTL